MAKSNKPADESAPDLTQLSFEEAMQQLEDIVNNLEQGNIPLDDSIHQFETGMKIAKWCESKLQDVQTRIEVITKKHGVTAAKSPNDKTSD